MVFISSECKSQPGFQHEPAPSLRPGPLLVYICQIWVWTASPRPALGQVHGGGICGGSRGQRPLREATLAPVSHVQTCPVGTSQVLGVVGGQHSFVPELWFTHLPEAGCKTLVLYPISISTEVIRVSRQHLKVQGSSLWDGYRVIPWEFPCGHGRGEGPLWHQNSSHYPSRCMLRVSLSCGWLANRVPDLALLEYS